MNLLLPPSLELSFAAVGRFTPVSVLAALLQAVLIAAAAQDRQRAADMAAAAGAAMYRFLADNAMDLITRHSADGRIRFASPASSALLGRQPDEMIGLALPSLVHPDDLRAVHAALVESSYFGRAGEAEVRLALKQPWRPLGVGGVSAARLGARMNPSEPADIVAVTRDITERKAHERELVGARDARPGWPPSRAKSPRFPGQHEP